MAEIDGTANGETLNGTLGDDIINGLAGNDQLYGNDGSDTLNGGEDGDYLQGGLGNDTLNGDAGNDNLYGGSGDDTLNGGDGNDYLYDYQGANIFVGGAGNDIIQAENYTASSGTVDAGTGSDIIYAGYNVTVDAGADNDTIYIWNSNVTLTTGAGSDTIQVNNAYTHVVTDFTAGHGGDIYNLTGLLSNLPSYPGGNPFATGHMRVVQSGANTLVQVDYDGSANGANWSTMATMQNVTAADLTAFNFGGYGTDGTIQSTPSAVPASASGDEDTAITGQLTAVDPDSTNVTFALASGPSHGTLTLNSSGSWSYTPHANYNGTDSFTFTANDQTETSTPATVNLTIDPVDDEATGTLGISGTAEPGGSLTAVLTQASDPDGAIINTAYNWQMLVDGTWTDITDADDATLNIPSDGSYVGQQVRPIITTTDATGGTTEFPGSATTITDVNHAPTVQNSISDQNVNEDAIWNFQVPANTFSDADGDSLEYSAVFLDDAGNPVPKPSWLSFNSTARTFSGTPPLDYFGYVIIQVIASDGSNTVADTFTLTIDPVHDAAVIGNPTISGMTEDVAVVNGRLSASGTIAIADGDPGEAAFTTVSPTSGNFGTLILGADGSYTYSVSNFVAQFLGDGMTKVDTFTVSSVDGTTKQVNFTINGANEVRNGTSGNDKINGTLTHDTINGFAGHDTLNGGSGNDKIYGGDGNDKINGGAGADLLDGGAGNDTFIFESATEIGNDIARDVIETFGLGDDVINLKALDANIGMSRDQAFKFVAQQSNSAVANSITWYQDTANDRTIVQGDVNGDGVADFQIELTGLQTLTSGDFLL